MVEEEGEREVKHAKLEEECRNPNPESFMTETNEKEKGDCQHTLIQRKEMRIFSLHTCLKVRIMKN